MFNLTYTQTEKAFLETALFTFLKKHLKLDIKVNKRNQIFAHFCGFKNHNEAKNTFSKLQKTSAYAHRGLPELINSSTATSDLKPKEYLFEFLKKELSLSFNSSEKVESLWTAFNNIWQEPELNEFNLSVQKFGIYDYQEKAMESSLDKAQASKVTTVMDGIKKDFTPMIISPKPEARSGWDIATVFPKDGNIQILEADEELDLAGLLKRHQRIVSIHRDLRIGAATLPYSARSELVMSDKKLVLIAPASLLFNYKRELQEHFNITDVAVIRNKNDFSGFDSKVTIISPHLFAKLEITDTVNALAVQDYYPMNMKPESKTQQGVFKNMGYFTQSVIQVDSLSGLAHSINLPNELYYNLPMAAQHLKRHIKRYFI